MNARARARANHTENEKGEMSDTELNAMPSSPAEGQLYIHVDSQGPSLTGEVVAVTVDAPCRSTGRTGRIERTNWNK